MPHPHQAQFNVLTKVHKAELGKVTLSRHDVDNFMHLFEKEGKMLEGGDLINQIKFLDNIIHTAFTKLRDTKMRHELSFVMARERTAMDGSFTQSAKERHASNLEKLEIYLNAAISPEIELKRVARAAGQEDEQRKRSSPI